MPTKVTLIRTRGDDTSYYLDLDNGNNQPLDITGGSAILSVSPEREPDTANYLFQITGNISGDPINGRFEFPFTVTEANNVGKYYFDISYTNSGGKTRTVKKGSIIWEQDIGK